MRYLVFLNKENKTTKRIQQQTPLKKFLYTDESPNMTNNELTFLRILTEVHPFFI